MHEVSHAIESREGGREVGEGASNHVQGIAGLIHARERESRRR